MLANAIFHHVGVACKSIERTSELYVEAGYERSETIFDPIQQVRIAFLEKEGSPLIELVEPVGNDAPVRNILKKVGVSAYHFCYEIENIEESVGLLREKDFVIVVDPVEAVAFDGRKICFIYHPDTGLIELLERKHDF